MAKIKKMELGSHCSTVPVFSTLTEQETGRWNSDAEKPKSPQLYLPTASKQNLTLIREIDETSSTRRTLAARFSEAGSLEFLASEAQKEMLKRERGADTRNRSAESTTFLIWKARQRHDPNIDIK